MCESRRRIPPPTPLGQRFAGCCVFMCVLACVVDEDEAHLEACQALLEDSV
jgi:hypothetical protein